MCCKKKKNANTSTLHRPDNVVDIYDSNFEQVTSANIKPVFWWLPFQFYKRSKNQYFSTNFSVKTFYIQITNTTIANNSSTHFQSFSTPTKARLQDAWLTIPNPSRNPRRDLIFLIYSPASPRRCPRHLIKILISAFAGREINNFSQQLEHSQSPPIRCFSPSGETKKRRRAKVAPCARD